MTALTEAQAARSELRLSDAWKRWGSDPSTHVFKCGQHLDACIAALQPAPPPPPPPPATTVKLGVSNNLTGGGSRQHVLDLGVKLIREDNPSSDLLSWAASDGLTVVGIMYGATTGLNAPVIEGDNEPYNISTWDIVAWAARMLACAKAVKVAGRKFLLPVGPPWNNGNVLYGAAFAPDAHKAMAAEHEGHTNLRSLAHDDHRAELLDAVQQKYGGAWTDCVAAINSAQPTIWQYVDGISVHPYSQPYDPSIRSAILDKWRSNLTAIGHGAIPFWLTEFGWPTGGSTWPGANYNEQTQADYYTKAFQTFGSRSDVAAMIPYRLDDFGARDADSEHWFGLNNADGSHKAAYATVKSRVA